MVRSYTRFDHPFNHRKDRCDDCLRGPTPSPYIEMTVDGETYSIYTITNELPFDAEVCQEIRRLTPRLTKI